MKFSFLNARNWTAALFVAAGIVFAGPAWAEKAPTVILIVNMTTLFNASEVGQDSARQLRELTQALQAEDQAIRDAMTAEAETLRGQQGDLTEEGFAGKVGELARRQQLHLQEIGQRQRAIQLGQAQANAEIAAVIKPIFSELLVKHGAGLLIDQSNILAGGLDLNITSEAMALLNQRLPKLTVTPVNE